MTAPEIRFRASKLRFSISLAWRAWRLGGEKTSSFRILPQTSP
jgi:hypothetical protein